jgi:hypothetical protein
MRVASAFGVLVIGGALLGACQLVAGVRNDAVLGTGGGFGFGGFGSGGGSCTSDSECDSLSCLEGICCPSRSKDTLCKDICGKTPNDCGVSIDCGGCTAPQTCGGTGTPNHCGCVACTVWAKAYGGSTVGLNGASIGVDAAGDVLVTGDFFGSINLGGGDLATVGDGDAFLGKLDPAGTQLSAKGFGIAGASQYGYAVAADAAGNVVVAGGFQGSIDLGGGPLTAASSKPQFDIFVAKFDAAGAHVWSKSFGSTLGQKITGLALDSTGAAIFTGDFASGLDLGGGPLANAGGLDVFVAKLDPTTGVHVWSKSFGAVADQHLTGVAVDGADSVLVSGYFSSGIDFGAPVGMKTSMGGQDLFVAKLDSAGAVVWGNGYGDGSDQLAYGVAANAAGDVLVTGGFQGNIDFSGGIVQSTLEDNAFLAKLDAGGNHVWSKSYGGIGASHGRRVAFSASGDVLVAGDVNGSIDLGGGPVSTNGPGLFVGRFDGGAVPRWGKTFTGSSTTQGQVAHVSSLAVAPTDDVLLGGTFAGGIDFDLGPLVSSNAIATLFIAKLSPL